MLVVGAENLYHQVIFMEDATTAVTPLDAEMIQISRLPISGLDQWFSTHWENQIMTAEAATTPQRPPDPPGSYTTPAVGLDSSHKPGAGVPDNAITKNVAHRPISVSS